jgi:hypothetical protein
MRIALTIFSLVSLFVSVGCSSDKVSARSYKTKYVFVLVVDGPRFSETWGDPFHANIPYMDSILSKEGVVYTNFSNEGPTYTVSGHTAIATGYYQEMNNAGTELPDHPTIFQTYFFKAGNFLTSSLFNYANIGSGITERVGELAILIDTSGSTYAPGVLPAFMTEAKAICDTVKPSRVHIIYWDTSVCQAEVYEQHELDGMITSTQPKGGGGTDIRCAIEYMRKQNITPQASIVLTDGYLGSVWGQWNHPVLWTILDNKSAVPDCGQAVHINSENM